MKYLNIGNGKDYKEGWVNLDSNKDLKADVYYDIRKGLPFGDKTFDYILVDNVIEHIPMKSVYLLMQEIHRVLKTNGITEIYTPHFTGIGIKYLSHYRGFGINSFHEFDLTDIDTMNKNYPKFKIKQKLILISRNSGCKTIFRFVNIFNFLFNFSFGWQQFCEKFWIGGFEEIKYVMEKK
jgi:predicted SAM-dependent methyltransferase